MLQYDLRSMRQVRGNSGVDDLSIMFQLLLGDHTLNTMPWADEVLGQRSFRA